jgi:hypothetical protein
MSTHEERWGIFVDFAAIVHDLLTEAQAEMAEATLLDPVTPAHLEQLETLWHKLTIALSAFTRSSILILHSVQLKPEEELMANRLVEKINEAAGAADEHLRLFFQKTGLAASMPSREESGEGLHPHTSPGKFQ